jgi:hypothetical protein
MIDELQFNSMTAAKFDDSINHGGIIYQFAWNHAQYDDVDSIEVSSKKCSQEIKAIQAINQLPTLIGTTLMCLVDYKGFRVVAYASLPLNDKASSKVHKIVNP